jgi:hypothetical protein
LHEVSEFFQHGDCGFSCTRRGDSVEGIQLKTLDWSLQPLAAMLPRAAFCFDPARFPEGSIEFDCGLLMRRIRTACSFKL